MFNIKTKSERVSNLIAWYSGLQKKVTDFFPGASTRSKFEAIAVEMEEMDYSFYRAIKKAIPVAIYRAFDFNRLAPSKATGKVSFQCALPAGEDIVIPAGTMVSTEGSTQQAEKKYVVTTETTLTAGGTSVLVPVVAVVAGVIGNTGADTITVMKNLINGIDSITNPSELSNGSDAETEEDRGERFRAYIASLSRGTAEALEYGAKGVTLVDGNGDITERIIQAKAITITDPTAGYADLHVYNGVGGTSPEIVAEVQKTIDGYVDGSGNRIPGYKAAGVDVTVAAVTEEPQAITVTVDYHDIYDEATVQGAVNTAIAQYVSSLRIGDDLVYNELIERIMAVDGVLDCNLTAPAANVTPTGAGSLITSGTVTITMNGVSA